MGNIAPHRWRAFIVVTPSEKTMQLAIAGEKLYGHDFADGSLLMARFKCARCERGVEDAARPCM